MQYVVVPPHSPACLWHPPVHMADWLVGIAACCCVMHSNTLTVLQLEILISPDVPFVIRACLSPSGHAELAVVKLCQ